MLDFDVLLNWSWSQYFAGVFVVNYGAIFDEKRTINNLNKMQLKIFLIGTLFAITTATYGQTKMLMQFFGYSMMEYQHPVQVSGSKYQAYFKNMGESNEQGRIVIDETAKTFTIKWNDGEDWECKFSKKETKIEHDDFLGEVVKTIYTGKWTDDNFDCILIFSKTKSSGCVTMLKSKKVIDTDYSIDTWKKSFTFGTARKCLDDL